VLNPNIPPGLIQTNVLTTTLTTMKPLNEADYPKVQYWHRSQWLEHQKEKKGLSSGVSTDLQARRGNSRAAQGINVTMLFVENDQGQPIDGRRASAIRSLANNVFQQLKNHGSAPSTWSQAGNDIKKHYNSEMETQFPELQLCADHWKAQSIATLTYPSWHSNHCGSGRGSSKPEDSATRSNQSQCSDDVQAGPSGKRPNPNGEGVDESPTSGVKKRAKRGVSQSGSHGRSGLSVEVRTITKPDQSTSH
jgi:hypothetical protein